MAENERANIKQRQAEGIAAAKSRGVRFGRPSIPLPDNFEQIRDDWRKGLISMNEAAALCGICPKTFYYKAVKTERVNTDEGE